ncbi:uncharacterized protein F5147DRAFT_838487 [Suillus discolor]|uniref:Transmembrane protein n=1 Tax=Suillus discolor TaxID=1912936 RepID=A0A9P7JS23_9AGAM|nr:uncharacterized protein F5147DRAFT_838487 [Suillus discolor]KAG2103785.1 hypothetical protein F5147DRAFT_838487 [Suillus discolor]
MAVVLKYIVAEVLILSGTYMCDYEYKGNAQLLISMLWMLYTVWEVLALCLSVRIAVKHFHDLRRLGLSRSIIGDCFRVLMKSHVLYFASFVCVSCIQFVTLSPELQNPYFIGTQILGGIREFVFGVQLFVLGPRLVLSVREYHANLMAEYDAEASINPIVFQERTNPFLVALPEVGDPPAHYPEHLATNPVLDARTTHSPLLEHTDDEEEKE